MTTNKQLRIWRIYSRDDSLDVVVELPAPDAKTNRPNLHLVKLALDDAEFIKKVESTLKAAEDDLASAAGRFIEVGRMLRERKEAGKLDGSIPHGQRVPWLKTKFPQRSYNRLGEYMRVAEAMEDEATKTRLSGFLPQGIDAVLDEVRRLKHQDKPKPDPVTVPGSLAARMKLIRGDCREVRPTITEAYIRATFPMLKDSFKQFWISDVPYNIGKKGYDGYDDAMPENEYQKMLVEIFKGKPAVIILDPEKAFNLLGGGILDRCKKIVAWVYNSNLPNQFRLVMWFNCEPDLSKLGQDYKNPNDKRIQKLIEEGHEARLYDVWYIDLVKNVSKDHDRPCPIPVELPRRIILTTTNPGDVILDPFSGSGTIPCVAAALGRYAIGIEQSEKYCKIARNRLGTMAEELGLTPMLEAAE